jgi:hypothetical protein
MPDRILLHPGFHKTGTSSIQHLLWSNRDILAPQVGLVMLRHLKPAVKICIGFSRSRNPLALVDLAEALQPAFAGVDSPNLVISCEGLAGDLPGWPGVADYGAAALTIAYVCGYLAEWFPGADMQVALTIRDPDAWLYSTWRHHLLGHRLTLGRDEFAAHYAGAADLAAIARDIGGAVDLPVTTLRLEDMQAHRHGPGGALLDLLDLPSSVTDRIVPVGRDNAGPGVDLSEQFLVLNQSTMSDADVVAKKQALAVRSNLGGWVRT